MFKYLNTTWRDRCTLYTSVLKMHSSLFPRYIMRPLKDFFACKWDGIKPKNMRLIELKEYIRVNNPLRIAVWAQQRVLSWPVGK